MQICEQVNAGECAYYILDRIKANKKRDLLDWITKEEMSYCKQYINEVYYEIYTERLMDGTIFLNAIDMKIVVNESLAFVELLRMWAENYLKQNPAKSLCRVDPTADMQAIEKVKREMKRVNIAFTS